MILLILCSCCCQSSELQCDRNNEYEKDGRCCSLCKPGQWLSRDCAENTDTLCVACSVGEYQDKYNRETSCLLHRECNEQLGFEKIREGTPTSNVNCTCKLGKHCSSAACETCVSNKQCGPGEGVVQKATSSSDTQCSPCKEGTFSDTVSDLESCKNWSKCGDTETIKQPGTSNADVFCEQRLPDDPSNTWVYIVVIMVVVVALVFLAIFFIRKSNRKNKNKNRQNPPEVNNQEQLIKPKEGNQPEEDQDDQDITMQGLPVAQEQGKDYHISQEEV